MATKLTAAELAHKRALKNAQQARYRERVKAQEPKTPWGVEYDPGNGRRVTRYFPTAAARKKVLAMMADFDGFGLGSRYQAKPVD